MMKAESSQKKQRQIQEHVHLQNIM